MVVGHWIMVPFAERNPIVDRLHLKMTVPYATLWLGLALTVIAVVGYSWHSSWNVQTENIVKIIVAGIGVTTALYAAMNLARLNRAHEETVELKKKELSAKFIERWLDPKMTETLLSIDAFVKEAPKMADDVLAAKMDSEQKIRHDCLFVLGASLNSL